MSLMLKNKTKAKVDIYNETLTMGILTSKQETDEIKERLKDIDNIFNNFSKGQVICLETASYLNRLATYSAYSPCMYLVLCPIQQSCYYNKYDILIA